MLAYVYLCIYFFDVENKEAFEFLLESIEKSILSDNKIYVVSSYDEKVFMMISVSERTSVYHWLREFIVTCV